MKSSREGPPAKVVWLLVEPGEAPAGDDWLRGAERETLAALTLPKRRGEWRLGRWAAKRAVADRLAMAGESVEVRAIEIRAAPDGAPEALFRGEVAPVVVSISHRADVALAMAAPAGTRLGCDLELIEPRSEGFVRDYFTDAEIGQVEHAPELLHPLLANLLWSAKESALKALRTGLRRDTRSVEVVLSDLHRLDGWTALSVHDTTSGRDLGGWWRTRGSHLVTCIADPPSSPPRWAR